MQIILNFSTILTIRVHVADISTVFVKLILKMFKLMIIDLGDEAASGWVCSEFVEKKVYSFFLYLSYN